MTDVVPKGVDGASGSAAGGSVYAALIERELGYERARRVELVQRGVSVVTTSGALSTLVLGFGALATSKDDHPSALTTALLVPALVGFVTAAAFGLMANRLKRCQVAAVKTLERMPGEHWNDDEGTARRNVAAIAVQTLRTMRNGKRQEG